MTAEQMNYIQRLHIKWSIENFNVNLFNAGEAIESQPFRLDKTTIESEWVIKVYPKGDQFNSRDTSNIVIKFCFLTKPKSHSSIKGQYSLKLSGKTGPIHQIPCIHLHACALSGYNIINPKFQHPNNNLIDETLVIDCELQLSLCTPYMGCTKNPIIWQRSNTTIDQSEQQISLIEDENQIFNLKIGNYNMQGIYYFNYTCLKVKVLNPSPLWILKMRRKSTTDSLSHYTIKMGMTEFEEYYYYAPTMNTFYAIIHTPVEVINGNINKSAFTNIQKSVNGRDKLLTEIAPIIRSKSNKNDTTTISVNTTAPLTAPAHKIDSNSTSSFENPPLIGPSELLGGNKTTANNGNTKILSLKSFSTPSNGTPVAVSDSVQDEKFSSFFNALNKMWKAKQFCDITLMVGSHKLPAHKAILCARSLMFYDTIVKQVEMDTLNITDLSFDNLAILLDFMYSDSIPNESDITEELLFSASKYQINDLKEICENSIIKRISKENIESLLVLADRCNAVSLKRCAIDFIKANLDSFGEIDDLKRVFMEVPALGFEIFQNISLNK